MLQWKSISHIVICGLPGSRIFFSILPHKRHHFRGKKGAEHEMCVVIAYTTFVIVWIASKMWSKVYTSLHAKYTLLSDLKENWILPTDFRKINIKFHENPSSTDRHDEASSRLQQFCGERAYKPLTELRDLKIPAIRYTCFPKIHGKTFRTVAVATARQSLAFDHM